MMPSSPRNADPMTDLVATFRQLSQQSVDRVPFPMIGTVITVGDDLAIKFDDINALVKYTDGFYVVSDHLHLEVDERVIAIPLTPKGDFYLVVAKFSKDNPILKARLGDNYNNSFVGFDVTITEDRATRTPTIFALTWNTIRGSVGGVFRALTHIAHYHSFSPNSVVTSESAGHTHTVTLPNTHTATNPE